MTSEKLSSNLFFYKSVSLILTFLLLTLKEKYKIILEKAFIGLFKERPGPSQSCKNFFWINLRNHGFKCSDWLQNSIGKFKLKSLILGFDPVGNLKNVNYDCKNII